MGRRTGAHSPEPFEFTSGRHHALPAYLHDVYSWAYLNPRNARLLDNEAVVNTLLWGNSGRLRRALLAEITAGDRVLQAAHVYGRLIPELAKTIGKAGRLDVIDVAPLQAALCRRKLLAFSNARARIADAIHPGEETYDAVVCFFLLHELPKTYKCDVVDALLSRLSPGGKVVFIDYHAPVPWHPLRGFMRQIYDRLEPFAEAMWHHEISDFASEPASYTWRKETYFGGLYQKTVASVAGP
jgi:SAM-dependent methyltransferase